MNFSDSIIIGQIVGIDFSDPRIIGLTLIIIGVIGLVGGFLKIGVFEINLQTAKGRVITIILSLLVIVGLAIMVIDMVIFR